MKRPGGGSLEPAQLRPSRGDGSIGATIGERGFRRWYERQLIHGFLHMITGVLALIMMSIALEMLEFRATPSGLLALAAVAVAGGGLCIVSWRKFHWLLWCSEYLAERATCSQCHAYGRFTVLSSRDVGDSPAGCSIDVRCRGCGNEWTMT